MTARTPIVLWTVYRCGCLSWHTRQSGTYRLFDVLIGHRSGTYADALRYAKGEQ